MTLLMVRFRVDKNYYKILILFVQKHFFIEIAFAQVNVELYRRRKKRKKKATGVQNETGDVTLSKCKETVYTHTLK